MNWAVLGYVLRGKQRRKMLLLELSSHSQTPSELSRQIGWNIANTSRTLKELQVKGLVECHNPSEKMGRLYGLTNAGKKLVRTLKQRDRSR